MSWKTGARWDGAQFKAQANKTGLLSQECTMPGGKCFTGKPASTPHCSISQCPRQLRDLSNKEDQGYHSMPVRTPLHRVHSQRCT